MSGSCPNHSLCPNSTADKQPSITNAENHSLCELPSDFMWSPWLRNYRFAIDVVVVSIIFVSGVTGNTFSFIVLVRDRGRKGTTNFILQSLAVFDTLFLLCCFFFQVMKTLAIYTEWIDYYNFDAHFVVFFLYGTGMAIRMMRNWTVVVVSVERWIGVCRSLHAPVICTMRKARMGLGAVVVGSLVFTAPMYALPMVEENWNPCRQRNIRMIRTRPFVYENTAFRVGYRMVAYFIVIIGVPTTMLVVFNFLLISGVRRANVERTQMLCRNNAGNHAGGSSSSSRPTRNLEVTRLCIGVVVVYIICEIPAIICEVLSHTRQRQVVNIVRPLANMMVSLNSGINFFIYVFLGKRFRRQFLALVCRKKRGAQNRILLLREFSHTNTTRLGSCADV